LLRAVLLGQAVVAVGVLVVALTRPAEPTTVATPGGIGNRTTSSVAGAPSTGVRVTASAAANSAQSARPVNDAGADRDPFELPYRSGADEPDPEPRKTPEEPPKQAEAPPRLLSTTGDGVGGPSTSHATASTGGSTYAGLPPVARAPWTPAPIALNEPRPLAAPPTSYRPVAVLGTSARAPRPATSRDDDDDRRRRPTANGERPPTPQSSDAADFLAFCRKPLAPMPGDRRRAELVHADGPDTAPPVFGYVTPPSPDAVPDDWLPGHPSDGGGPHHVRHGGKHAKPAYAIAIRDGHGRGAVVIRDFDSPFDPGDFDPSDCFNPAAIAAGLIDPTSAGGNRLIGGRRARRADRVSSFANAIIAHPAAARPLTNDDDAADVLTPIAVAAPVVFDPPALALPIVSLDTSGAVAPAATPEPGTALGLVAGAYLLLRRRQFRARPPLAG